MIGWLDGQAGASGDMLLGALVDAGVPIEVLQEAVDPLGLGLRFEASNVVRAGLGALKVDVVAPAETGHRRWSEVRQLLSALEAPDRALEVFARLAEAEAGVHRVPADEVEFHEVGSLDAIADIVGTVAGFAHLGLTELHCSTVAVGSGSSRGAHGPLPLPAPAVLALLAGKPVTAGAIAHESTTPTGAALLSTLVTTWGPLPAMTPATVGIGAGGRDPAEVANVLRLVLGEAAGEGPPTHWVVETNVDDLDPRLWPHVLSQLLAVGASDAWLTPILMKKGRPAHTLSVLCPSPLLSAVREVVFRETSTIGLREHPVTKHALPRTESVLDLDGQRIRVKTSQLEGQPVTSTPEWEDVLAAATALGRPAKQVLADAVARITARPGVS